MKARRTTLLAFVFLFPVIVIFSQCLSDQTTNAAGPRGIAYADAATCVKCHRDLTNSYQFTSHYQTSRPGSPETVNGKFSHGGVFRFTDSKLVKLQNIDHKLYQAGYVNNQLAEAHPVDITFGGVKAETYLYWQDNRLFELPLSWFSSLNSLTNSPGYAKDQINFKRAIVTRCFECHSSNITELPGKSFNQAGKGPEFDKHSLIYGIDCQRCHGPAAEHVNFHTNNPGVKEARYISKYSHLSRGQQMDACAVCHSGNKDNYLRSVFTFLPGDTLAHFKEPGFAGRAVDATTLDVHGNQTGLLAASKCYMVSKMTCLTCHDTHKKERGDMLAFSKKCMSCHSEANHNFCKKSPEPGLVLQANCIDCHMPAKPSNVIKVQAADGKMAVPYLVRTHRIAIYSDITKKLAALKHAGK
jgi:hypothetical protein